MKKKVLVVVDTGHIWGIELAAMRFQLGMDPEAYEYTYLIRLKDGGPLVEELLELGANIRTIPADRRSPLKSYAFIRDLCREQGFDIVHAHSTFFNAVTMMAAKKTGVKKRIAHAHMTGNPVTVKEAGWKKAMTGKLMQKLVASHATDLLACSQAAGDQQFGPAFAERGVILNNSVDVSKYRFQAEKRAHFRKHMGFTEETICLGHVGRFSQVKNQQFLIELFAEWQKKHPDSRLMLVGGGEKLEACYRYCQELGIAGQVIFTNAIANVEDPLQIMDVMVFPSLREGFPVSLIEAQAAKLPCLVSDTVTDQVKLNANVDFASLQDPKEVWIQKIEELLKTDREGVDASKVERAYSIQAVSEALRQIYEG